MTLIITIIGLLLIIGGLIVTAAIGAIMSAASSHEDRVMLDEVEDLKEIGLFLWDGRELLAWGFLPVLFGTFLLLTQI